MLTFKPSSFGSIETGGLIDPTVEKPAEALRDDLEYLSYLLDLISQQETIHAFWSHLHSSWVFWTEKDLGMLRGTRPIFDFAFRPVKKKQAFYEEILREWWRIATVQDEREL